MSSIKQNINLDEVEIRVLPKGEKNAFGQNLAAPIEAFFVKYREQLIWLHLAFFLFFMVLLILPLYLPDPAEDATPLSDFTSFSNYVMWGLWFPLVFLSVIFSGRSWCGIFCPMGAASEWANNIGFKKEIPAWIKWSGTPILSFILVTIWGQTIGVRDHAESLAIVFGSTMLVAIIIGLFYGRKKRAWCRHMCPIGLLLGVFSRLGAVQFAPKRKQKVTKRWTEKTACPTMIELNSKDESRHCIECFRCVNPKAKGGLFLKFRRPGQEVEDIANNNPNIAETWFFFLSTGLALGGFLWLVLPEYQMMRNYLGEWFIEYELYSLLESGPSWVMVVFPERREVFYWLDFIAIVSFMLGFMLLIGFILFSTTLMAAWISKKVDGPMPGSKNIRQRFIELSYQYAPVAMVSLILGLGAKLFELLTFTGITEHQIALLKILIFFLSIVWSLWLCFQILKQQVSNHGYLQYWAMLPGGLGSLAVGAAWWTAIGL